MFHWRVDPVFRKMLRYTRSVFLFLFAQCLSGFSIYAAPPDSLRSYYDLDDPRNPNCPCHAQQNLADKEFNKGEINNIKTFKNSGLHLGFNWFTSKNRNPRIRFLAKWYRRSKGFVYKGSKHLPAKRKCRRLFFKSGISACTRF